MQLFQDLAAGRLPGGFYNDCIKRSFVSLFWQGRDILGGCNIRIPKDVLILILYLGIAAKYEHVDG